MANIAATDVTVTFLNRRRSEGGKNNHNIKLTFGNAVLTYGAGGVPLTGAQLGCPNAVESLNVYGHTIGYEWSYDPVTKKLVANQGATGLLTEPSTVAIAAQTINCEVIGW